MFRFLSLIVLAGACFLVTSCGNKEFGDEMAGVLVTAQPIKLDGEQLVLTDRQVDCGTKNDLWEAPAATGGDRTIARLLPKGRALQFYDDVVVRDAGANQPTIQIRGQVQVEVIPPMRIRDDGPKAKLVTTKLGAVISHSCFGGSLPIMGISKGAFTTDALPVLRYQQDGEIWSFDRLVH